MCTNRGIWCFPSMCYSEYKILCFYTTVFLAFPNQCMEYVDYLSYSNTHISFVLFSRLGSMSQGKYFIITVVFIISSFPFCSHQACYRLSEGVKYVETQNCLGELLLLEVEKQGKTQATQSSWRGIQERRDVYSKGRLHQGLRDIPVPTIPAGSVFQKGFLYGGGDKGNRKHCEAGCKWWWEALLPYFSYLLVHWGRT